MTIRAEARKLKSQTSVTARELSRLLGKMNATASVGPLFCRNLQRNLSETLSEGAQSYESKEQGGTPTI